MRFIIALLSFSLAAFAVQTEAPKRLEELKTRLNLTPDQVEKITPIVQEEAAKLKEIRAKLDGGQANRRTKLGAARELRAVQQDIQARIEPILTKDQRTEWKKIREERKEELKELRDASK